MSPPRVLLGLACFQIPTIMLALLFGALGDPEPLRTAALYGVVLLAGGLGTWALEAFLPLAIGKIGRRFLRYQWPSLLVAQLPLFLSTWASATLGGRDPLRLDVAAMAYGFFLAAYLIVIGLPLAFLAQWRVLTPPERREGRAP